jgi:hypothetical protein
VWRRAAWVAVLAVLVVLTGVVAGAIVAREASADFSPHDKLRSEFRWPNHDIFKVGTIVSVTIARLSVFSEAVIIRNSTPDIQIEISFLSYFVLIITYPNDFAALNHFPAGRQRIVAFRKFFIDRKIASAAISVGHPLNGPFDVLGGQVSCISNDDVGMAFFGCIQRADPTRLDANISALENAGVLYLSSDSGSSGPPQQYSGYKQQSGKRSNWIIECFRQQPKQIILVSAILGALCAAIGFTLNMKRDRRVSFLGGALVVLGLLAPIFPWWLVPFLWWSQ